MNEAGFIRALRTRLPEHLVVWKVADRVTRGVPDLVIFGPDGALLWLEAKYSKTNHLTRIKPKLSLPQLAWLQQRYDTGHNVGVIFGQPNGITLFWDKSWESSQHVQNCTWSETIQILSDKLTLSTRRGDHGSNTNNNRQPLDCCS